MHELARVTLENEMDLILAHKRSMKLGELAGLSLSAQTTFATAVSEVSRSTIESNVPGCLVLGVETAQRGKHIYASVISKQSEDERRQGLEYAKRLVDKHNVSTQGDDTYINLFYFIPSPVIIDIQKLDEWRIIFRNEPPVSPYEEIKRKNAELQDLSDKFQKSEARYKTLTNALPLIIFSLGKDGELEYANEWLFRFTGQSLESLNQNKWQSVIHSDDYDAFSNLLQSNIHEPANAGTTHTRFKNTLDDSYVWHQVSLSPIKNEKNEFLNWIGFMVDIHAQKVFEETLKDNFELKQAQKQLQENQQTLEKYIEELNRSNEELQQFAFVASHDLQEPVRKLLFYSDYLVNSYANEVDTKGATYLKNLQASAHRMRTLISDLLTFSQINKQEINFKQVDLNEVAANALQDLEMVIEDKKAEIQLQNLPVIEGDQRMLVQLFENIIGNSLKYSKQHTTPQISISATKSNGRVEISFSDNGIGFNEQYLDRMFTLFQRLHSREAYEGTGLGLAICKRIADIHKGKIVAKSNEGEGAVFYINLPVKQ